jgi:hypothetical protein
VVLNALPARAENAAPGVVHENSPILEIKEKLMYLKVGLGEGLMGMSVFQNGAKLDLGYFGGNLEAYFKESPEALETATGFRTRQIVGFVMWSAGMAAVIADIILIPVLASQGREPFLNNQGVLWGLLIGGSAVGTSGALVLDSAVTKLAAAVNQFNAHLLNEHLPPAQKIDYHIFVSRCGAGAGLRFHF